MKMIKIYIWRPKALSLGHASAQIGCNDEEYATYISWWPSDDGNPLKPNPGENLSYEEDVEQN